MFPEWGCPESLITGSIRSEPQTFRPCLLEVRKISSFFLFQAWQSFPSSRYPRLFNQIAQRDRLRARRAKLKAPWQRMRTGRISRVRRGLSTRGDLESRIEKTRRRWQRMREDR